MRSCNAFAPLAHNANFASTSHLIFFNTNTIHHINILVLSQFNTVLMQPFKHIDNYFAVHTNSQNSKTSIFGSRLDPTLVSSWTSHFTNFDCIYRQPVSNISKYFIYTYIYKSNRVSTIPLTLAILATTLVT